MPRKKSTDAKDVTMSARFTDAEAAQIDAARGATDRSVWLRQAALASLGAKEPAQVKTGARRGAKPAAAPPEPPLPRPKKATGECPPHPKGRVNKGFCGACGRPAT